MKYQSVIIVGNTTRGRYLSPLHVRALIHLTLLDVICMSLDTYFKWNKNLDPMRKPDHFRWQYIHTYKVIALYRFIFGTVKTEEWNLFLNKEKTVNLDQFALEIYNFTSLTNARTKMIEHVTRRSSSISNPGWRC